MKVGSACFQRCPVFGPCINLLVSIMLKWIENCIKLPKSIVIVNLVARIHLILIYKREAAFLLRVVMPPLLECGSQIFE